MDPGGGLNSVPVPSEPMAHERLLKSQLWTAIGAGCNYEMQSSIFQPKGGMGMIGKAFGKELGPLIQYNAKVIDIHQDGKGVTATYIDSRTGGEKRTATADWCVCTIPASILSQIPMNVGEPMKAAINQLPYQAALKVGLQMKRRFWEQDDQIYGGHTYTNQPNSIIGYPMWDYFSKGKGVLLGAYTFGEPAFIAAAKSPEERIKDALEYGSKIHPQYKQEFECGVAVAWHRVPFTLGCAGAWTEAGRAAHYDNLCALDGRIVLAGEHASRIPGLAGRRGDIGDRRHHPPAQARDGLTMEKTMMTQPSCRRGRRLSFWRRPPWPIPPRPRLRPRPVPMHAAACFRCRAAKRSTRACARAATCPTPRARSAPACIRRWPAIPSWRKPAIPWA